MIGAGITEITYHFGDASVSPDFHRSYRITVTAAEVRIVVDSYGQPLADETCAIAGGRFEDLVAALDRHGISNCPPTDDEGCTGGTSETITCSASGTELFSGTVYHCGGNDTGDLCGDVSRFARKVKELIPDMERLLQ